MLKLRLRNYFLSERAQISVNTIWLKIAAIIIVIIGGFLAVSLLSEVKEKPKREEKTYQDVIEEDDRRLRAEPGIEKQPEIEEETGEETAKVEAKTEPKELVFVELSIEDQVQAEKLFEMALFHRKQGRLPGMRSYKMMVDNCRRIIKEFPGSTFSYKAKRMLGDLRPRDRKRYGITDEEIDLSSY